MEVWVRRVPQLLSSHGQRVRRRTGPAPLRPRHGRCPDCKFSASACMIEHRMGCRRRRCSGEGSRWRRSTPAARPPRWQPWATHSAPAVAPTYPTGAAASARAAAASSRRTASTCAAWSLHEPRPRKPTPCLLAIRIGLLCPGPNPHHKCVTTTSFYHQRPATLCSKGMSHAPAQREESYDSGYSAAVAAVDPV